MSSKWGQNIGSASRFNDELKDKASVPSSCLTSIHARHVTSTTIVVEKSGAHAQKCSRIAYRQIPLMPEYELRDMPDYFHCLFYFPMLVKAL